jgi:hypothetical protein
MIQPNRTANNGFKNTSSNNCPIASCIVGFVSGFGFVGFGTMKLTTVAIPIALAIYLLLTLNTGAMNHAHNVANAHPFRAILMGVISRTSTQPNPTSDKSSFFFMVFS